jgi:hypothetical protein
VDSAASVSLQALTAALLEELLPAGRDGHTVLLGCDDQALRSACRRAGAAGDPTTVLRSALAEIAPLTLAGGLRGALNALREPPADLAVLCACVLAASRMRADDQHATQAYYARLAELLGLPVHDPWPGVAGFERVPGRFAALAQWLERDQHGRRGRLALPSDPHPSLVGVPISQVLLRRVDRDRLGVLFDRYQGALRIGRDPLRLLRASSLRHELTAPAQRLLERPEMHEPLRAALLAAYQAWDGTVVDARGRRSRAGALRLGLSPGRMTLNVSLPALEAAVDVHDPDGHELRLPAWPEELTLPARCLAHAADGPVLLSGRDGPRVRALPGPLMLFDTAETGFWLTGTAGERPVIVLTCDPELVARDWGARRANVPLPAGWALICDVTRDELPAELRDPVGEEPALDGPVTLVGGLRLEAGAWLIDHPPALVGDLGEPVPVDLIEPDGRRRQLGELVPEEPFALDAIAAREGTHTIEVAGQAFQVELASRGLRVGVGALSHYPREPRLAFAGAADPDTAAPWGPPAGAVCGAAVDGVGDPAWQPPVTVRAQGLVYAIRRDGTVTAHSQGPAPYWARQAGLPPGGPWPIPDAETVVWSCVQSRSYPRVLALRDEPVSLTDEVLDLAERFADAPVIDRGAGEDAPARWQRIVDAALEEEAALDG